MYLLYNFFTVLSTVFIKAAALFSPKMKLFVLGRKKVFSILEEQIKPTQQTIWFHCASLGEYEQGLPVMQEVKKNFPNYIILLTFFSPSGYENKKNTSEADIVVYLPLDTAANARRFIELVNPSIAIFVKYEIWPNYLKELKKNGIHTILISGLFRQEQIYFKTLGFWMRDVLKSFDHFFVQNEVSKRLLENIGFNNVTISGDTRFDRVSRQIEIDNTLPFIEEFRNGKTVIVAGSTWPEDEDLLIEYINKSSKDVKYIIAPHNIKPVQIEGFRKELNKKTMLYSQKEGKDLSAYQVFIVDTIGLLTKIYSYADIAYVGGAMGNTGLHNILEPATFGVPILIGKNYNKFPEAKALRKRAGLFTVADYLEMESTLNKLIENKSFRDKTGIICEHFIQNQTGATTIILKYLINLPHIKSKTQ